MTLTSVKAAQLSNSQVQVDWSADADAAANWQIRRDDDGGGFNPQVNIFVLSARSWVDVAPAPAGTVVTYRVIDDLDTFDAVQFTMADQDQPYTFGPVDPLKSVPSYTSLDDVKARLGITHTESDTQLTTAIVSAEVAIDQWNGRSFPDIGTNPEIPGVPTAISEWALDAAIAIWKAADAPFGQGGSEAWLGALDISNITERVLRRHPLSLGYKVTWGMA